MLSVRWKEKKRERTEGSTPDNAFLVQKVINDFDAVPHLRLRTFRHWNDGTDDLARFNIIQGGNPVTSSPFQILPVTCQDDLLLDWGGGGQLLRHVPYPHLSCTVSIAHGSSPSGNVEVKP